MLFSLIFSFETGSHGLQLPCVAENNLESTTGFCLSSTKMIGVDHRTCSSVI